MKALLLPLFVLLIALPARAQVAVSLPTVTATSGTSGTLSITTGDVTGTNAFSFDFTMTFDPAVLSVTGYESTGTVADGCNIQSNVDTPGQIVVSAACGSALSGSGELLRLTATFDAAGTSSLGWAAFVFNEGNPAASPTGGQVTVTAPGSADVPVSLPSLSGTVGQSLEVAVSTGDLTGLDVYSFDFTVTFDPAVLSISVASSFGTLSSDCSVQANTAVAGSVRVSGGCTAPLAGSGSLVSLTFGLAAEGTSALGWSSFTYNEGSPGVELSSGSVTVTGSTVTAADDAAQTQEDAAVVISVLANDSASQQLDPGSLVISTAPGAGSAAVVAGAGVGTVRYTPPADYNGQTSFGYRVSDTSGNVSGEATVTVTVLAVNDAPTIAVNAVLSLGFGETAIISAALLRAADVDDAAASLVFSVGSIPARGTLLRNGAPLLAGSTFSQADVSAGSVAYRHAGVTSGTDAFSFTVRDALGASATGTFGVQVDPPAGLALSVGSQNPETGVAITISPSDMSGAGDGETPFTRTFSVGTVVSLTAPSHTDGGNEFVGWLRNGTFVSTARTLEVTLGAATEVAAAFVTVPRLLTVASDPQAGLSVLVSPSDRDGLGSGVTPFSRTFVSGSQSITLGAPSQSAAGHAFAKWLCEETDGTTSVANGRALTLQLAGPVTCTAAYLAPPGGGTAHVDPQGLRVFRWDVVLAAERYQIQVADRPFGTAGAVVLVDDAGLASGTFTAGETAIPSGINHYWRVRSGTLAGAWSAWSESLVIGTHAENVDLPTAPELELFPNPAVGALSLRYGVERGAPVRLRVVDVVGRNVHLAAERFVSAGRHEAVLDTADWPAGAYFVLLETEGRVVTRPVMVVR